jgi:DNA-binding MarR family transcriptional regulator
MPTKSPAKLAKTTRKPVLKVTAKTGQASTLRSASCVHRGRPPESLMAMSGFMMIKLGQYVQDESEKIFEGLGGPGMKVRHFGVLHVLISEGPSTQQFLCSGMWIDRGSMVGVIDVLEKNGLVQRKANPDDQRSHVLSVTAEGRKFHSENESFFVTLESKIFPNVTDSERNELKTILRKMMRDTCQA